MKGNMPHLFSKQAKNENEQAKELRNLAEEVNAFTTRLTDAGLFLDANYTVRESFSDEAKILAEKLRVFTRMHEVPSSLSQSLDTTYMALRGCMNGLRRPMGDYGNAVQDMDKANFGLLNAAGYKDLHDKRMQAISSRVKNDPELKAVSESAHAL